MTVGGILGIDSCIKAHLEDLLRRERDDFYENSDKRQLLESLIDLLQVYNDDCYSFTCRKNKITRHYVEIADILQIDLDSMVNNEDFDPDLDSLFIQMELLGTTYQVYSKREARNNENYENTKFYKDLIASKRFFDCACNVVLNKLFSPYCNAIEKKDSNGRYVCYRNWGKFRYRFLKIKTLLEDMLNTFQKNINECSCDYDTSKLSVRVKHEQYLQNLYYLQKFPFLYEEDVSHIKGAKDIPFPDIGDGFTLYEVSEFYHALFNCNDSVEKIEERLSKFASNDPYLNSFLVPRKDNPTNTKYKINYPLIFIAHYIKYRKKNEKGLSMLVKSCGIPFPSEDFNKGVLPSIELAAEMNLSIFYAKIFPKPKYVKEVVDIFNKYLKNIEVVFGSKTHAENDPRIFSQDFQIKVLKYFNEISTEIIQAINNI